MAENEPLPEGEDFVKGLLQDVDSFLNGKKVPQVEVSQPEKEGVPNNEESYTIEAFIHNQIPFTPNRNPREETEGFFRAFPVWKESTLEILGYHNDIPNREKYITILQDLTLDKVALLAKQKLEELARKRGRMVPDENDREYIQVSNETEYWSRVEEIAVHAARLGKNL